MIRTTLSNVPGKHTETLFSPDLYKSIKKLWQYGVWIKRKYVAGGSPIYTQQFPTKQDAQKFIKKYSGKKVK